MVEESHGNGKDVCIRFPRRQIVQSLERRTLDIHVVTLVSNPYVSSSVDEIGSLVSRIPDLTEVSTVSVSEEVTLALL